MTLSDWGSIAQIVIAVITLIGVLISIWLSTRALREVQFDRRLRSKPHLSFEGGGWRFRIEFVKMGYKVPGYDPTFLKDTFKDLPPDAESVRIKLDKPPKNEKIGYGRLRNHGGGPALNTRVTWIPEEVWIGKEKFEINQKKLEEPVYNPGLNNWPTIPGNIQPLEEATIHCIPTFIIKDFEKKITKVDGILQIKCTDIFDDEHLVYQEFHLFTHYQEEEPKLHVTFSSLRA